MSAKFVYLSKAKIQELEAELKDLKTRGRKEIAQKIADARSHGDLRENADYDAAKEEQAHLERRIAYLEDILSRARTIDPKEFEPGVAALLTRVRVRNVQNGYEMEYVLVSPEESDINQNKISVTSPVGKALMGKREGETVKVKVPAGWLELEILSVERVD